MKTLLTKLSLLSLALTMGLTSCTEEDGLTPTGNGVKNLSANARSSTAINVRWEAGSATDTLYVVSPTGTTTTFLATQGTEFNTAVATGLTKDVDYTFTVHNAAGTSSSLTWSPATRWPSESNTTQTVRIYSTAAPLASQPSGLIIDGDGITAISTESADSASIDMVLAYNPTATTPVSLLSPGVTGSGINIGKRTSFISSEPAYNVQGGLDADYYTGPITSLITVGSILGVDIDKREAGDSRLGKSVIVPFLTADNHYGRIELVPQLDGQVYGTMTSSGKTFEYVDVKVSYQTQAGKGYVARPAARGHWPSNTAMTSPSVKR